MTPHTLNELYQEMALPVEQRVIVQHGVTSLAAEFRGIYGRETVERFVADSLYALKGARVRQYLPLFAERFARDRLWSLEKVEGRSAAMKPIVLFLCVHNAGRSQMAAGWLRHLAGDSVQVMTGGSDPASAVNPQAVVVMAEVGIDISQQFPKPWTDEVVRAADVVVTMGCGDACPLFPGKRYEDWAVADPAGQDLPALRAIRDDLHARVLDLLHSLSADLPPMSTHQPPPAPQAET
jgi:protein-tyrosine-phosphatase